MHSDALHKLNSWELAYSWINYECVLSAETVVYLSNEGLCVLSMSCRRHWRSF